MAQEAINQVTKGERLSTFADRPRFPYVGAPILELFRWHCVTPLGFPPSPSSNVDILGYEVPKRTVTFTNIWKVFRDPELFPNPEQFEPERFMEDNPARKYIVSYIWGRRYAPEDFRQRTPCTSALHRSLRPLPFPIIDPPMEKNIIKE